MADTRPAVKQRQKGGQSNGAAEKGGGANGQRGKRASSLWMAEVPTKRWTELFFLYYSPVWIIWALVIVVGCGLYEHLEERGYMIVGLLAAVPCFTVPLFFVGKVDKGQPFFRRHWVKANVWIAIFSFIGNYFWTHYFYTLLGAKYTFPSWRLNDVPIPLYFMTHAYFCFYHTLSNLVLRRLGHALSQRGPAVRWFVTSAVVIILAYITAFMETLTIAHFPYYTFTDKAAMYKYGSLFYGIYFIVSFPMYLRVDENLKRQWTIGEAALDSLAAGMLVTILLDLWRLYIGPIAPRFEDITSGRADGVLWVS